jgi:hypothetical protein
VSSIFFAQIQSGTSEVVHAVKPLGRNHKGRGQGRMAAPKEKRSKKYALQMQGV